MTPRVRIASGLLTDALAASVTSRDAMIAAAYRGASWSFFRSGTQQPAAIYRDPLLAQAMPSPVRTDTDGTVVPVFFDGFQAYRAICKAASGETLYDIDPLDLGIASKPARPGEVGVLGFIPSSTGVAMPLAEFARPAVIQAAVFGVRGDGRSDNTAALARALAAASGSVLMLPRGTVLFRTMRVPSDTTVIGEGIDATVLRQIAGVTGHLISNDSPDSAFNLRLEGFTVDGAAKRGGPANHGVLLDRATRCFVNIEVRNCGGSGIVVTGGRHHTFGRATLCSGNGRFGPGYGLFLYGVSDSLVLGGRYDDNCIGLAVEASGRLARADRNIIVNPSCRDNRDDFGQSGAGLHFEQSSGGVCSGCQVIGGSVSGSRGPGVVNSATDIHLSGITCRGNSRAGVATLAGRNFIYTALELEGNALQPMSGYQAEMLFDDSGLDPASRGLVAHSRLRGRSPDGGVKSMSPHSRLRFSGNAISGYARSYDLQGKDDLIDKALR